MNRAALLPLLLVAACGGGSTAATVNPPTSPTAAVALCSTIKLGASVDVHMLDAGCADPDRRTIVVLNHTKCRGDGGDFGTFDLRDTQSGEKTDQLFAYKGAWHSTNHEATLYQKAFTQCL